MTTAKENWLKGISSPNTRKIYGYYFDRLLQIEGLTPEEVLEVTRKNLDVYVRLKNAAKEFSEHGRVMAVAALRSFLLDGGIENLPAAHMKVPHRVKPSTYLTWDQAKSVCAAASKPYNMIFNLMLHCGWGSPKLNAYYKEIIQTQIANGIQELEQSKKLLGYTELCCRSSAKSNAH